ncbi:ribonuclease H-like domain-containing protein [Tanacetum coccineum]|uniref:Ribonuclease H-like domain-containing protein n=1 Tax=Tanacetum coccineum TaxID=301880 RepID=A0ABQ5CU60_9ASTR
MDEPNNPITPYHTTPPTSPQQPDTPPSHSSTSILTSAQTESHAQTVDSHTPIPINNSSQTMPTHPMVTRAKADIFKPLERMNCHVTTTSPLPRSHVHALRDPNWKEAMLDEYNALITNGTWVLVLRPTNVNVVHSMWLFKHKFNANGSLSRYKACLIANGCSKQQGSDIAYFLLYVDDTILTVSSSAFLQRIIASLHSEFAMTDLGSLNYFLGISAQRSASGLFLSQSKFAEEILERAHMQNCNPCRTPVDTESKLGSDGDPISDPALYCSLAGALQYLTFTRPDLSYTLHVSSTTQLSAYTDANWAGCPVTHRSTSGYCVFLGDNLLSWYVKRQVTLSRSSAEAEYRGVANVVAKTAWIRNLLCELHTPLCTATLVYCDNVSDIYMSANLVQRQRTKHIEIDIHCVCDFVASGQVHVLHVPSRFQYAYIFTKGLPTALFIQFRSSLNVRRSTPSIDTGAKLIEDY